ncbi:hypothetical protein [Nitratiruptor sp. YY09-18]|uniref:hypothetical protein n=1 Tax=Nitratiruptor sp. YY09-18 TaxID=2724901 RepID=UPI00191615EF|nr:hypothetical protein [Nitratiruptor sp. YY09-18]BCD68750.1 hypothetical protein NitYY0918_C1667 [Nitratiruptor sp. YY09-18]
MLEFLKKMTEWVLQKEEEMAKNCKLSIEDIDKQIEVVKEKKAKLEEECQKNIQELNQLLGRLESIKNIELAKCSHKD